MVVFRTLLAVGAASMSTGAFATSYSGPLTDPYIHYSIDVAPEIKGQGDRSYSGGIPYAVGPFNFDVVRNTQTFVDKAGLSVFAELGGVVMSTKTGGWINLDKMTLTSVTGNGAFLSIWVFDADNQAEITPFTNNASRSFNIQTPAMGQVQTYDLNIKNAQRIFFRMGMGNFVISNVTGAIPEPSTWVMMFVGFALVAGAARYGRRSATVTYS